MSTKLEVESFLYTLKEKIRISYPDIAYRQRDINNKALTDLEIMGSSRRKYLLNLKVEDYFNGPSEDTYDPEKPNYYEFGINIKGTEVYIKLSIGLLGKPVDVMSFHPVNEKKKKIVYPFKL